MSEFVKKTLVGYREVPKGSSDAECTHVILTIDEYKNMLHDIIQADMKTESIMQTSRKEIYNMKLDCKSALKESQEKYENEINKLKEELEQTNNEVSYQKELNRNLLRISRERANSDRKLKPKKEHTGYVVISSQEKEIKYKKGSSVNTAIVWETVFQTPYIIEFPENEARVQIKTELLSNEGGWKLNSVGIGSCFITNFKNLIEEYHDKVKTSNIAFNERMRANYKAGYWEYIVLHTLPLECVPKEMLP